MGVTNLHYQSYFSLSKDLDRPFTFKMAFTDKFVIFALACCLVTVVSSSCPEGKEMWNGKRCIAPCPNGLKRRITTPTCFNEEIVKRECMKRGGKYEVVDGYCLAKCAPGQKRHMPKSFHCRRN